MNEEFLFIEQLELHLNLNIPDYRDFLHISHDLQNLGSLPYESTSRPLTVVSIGVAWNNTRTHNLFIEPIFFHIDGQIQLFGAVLDLKQYLNF